MPAKLYSYDQTNQQWVSYNGDIVSISSDSAGAFSPGSPLLDVGSVPVGTATYAYPNDAIFISPGGSDTNSGTLSSPYATLTKAVGAASSGATIVLRAGEYNEGEDTQDQAYPFGVSISKSITIQNYPGEEVWFDGSIPVTGSWTKTGNTWYVAYDRIFNRSPTNSDGLDDGWGASSGAGGWWTDPTVPQAAWPDMVLLDGNRLEQVASIDDVTTGTFFIDGITTSGKWFQGTRIYIGDNPAGHEVRYVNKVKLMTLAGTSNTSTIRGVGIRRYASYNAGFGAMYVQHAFTMENVWVQDISTQFIALDSSPSSNFSKITARQIGFNFMGSNMANNVTVDRADLRSCNFNKFNLFGPSIATIKLNKCQFVTIKNSIFKDSYSSGFWCDSTCNTPVIINCLFQNLANRPIDYETASDGIIANTKFIHNGADTIFINDSDTTRIYNCTLAENNWGLRGTGGARGVSTSINTSPISIGQSLRRYDNSNYSFNIDSRLGNSYYTDFPQHQWTINHITICNTVIARTGIHTYDLLSTSNASDNFREAGRTFLANMNPVMNGNVYHWTAQPQYPWICAKGYNVSPQVYFSLSSFQSATGLDATSSFSSVDPLNANYKITNQTYHTNAVGLPSDIAALIGQSPGVKHAGTFW